MKDEYTLILTNTRDKREADLMIETLFEKRLVACVQTNNVYSHYYWKDKIMHDNEIRLLIKTKKSLFKQCEETILSIHSYDIPEIVELPITSGSKDFFNFVDYATRPNDDK